MLFRSNIYAGISIWDTEKKMWITKWDAGAESYTEKEKGEASDSFKRAGFNWGIGRELYTSPFIWIPSTKCSIVDSNGKKVCFDKFVVTNLSIANKEIVSLTIANKTNGIECFKWNKNGEFKNNEVIEDTLLTDIEAKSLYKALVNKLGTNENVIDYLDSKYGVEKTSKLMKSQYAEIVREMKK